MNPAVSIQLPYKDARLQDMIDGQRPYMFWGAGRPTRKREQLLMEYLPKPTAWIDVDPSKIGNRIADVPVIDFEALAITENRPFVLVYVNNHGAREQNLEALECKGYEVARDCLCVG